MRADPESLRGKRVLVTGAGGFLGAHAAKALAGAAKVHAVTRRDCDLADRDAVFALFEQTRPERVLHLAGYANGRQGVEHVYPSLTGDLLVTVHVLEAALRAGCERTVVTGSLEEPEDGAAAPSPYALAKRAAGDYAALFHRLYSLPVVTARIFMSYGPGQRADKLIPQMIDAFASGQAFELRSAERAVDWIYVDDVVEALLLALAARGLEGKTLEIGSGELVTVGEVARMVARSMDAQHLLGFAVADREDERVRRADAATTERALGWRARVPLAEGLRTTIAALAPEEAVQ